MIFTAVSCARSSRAVSIPFSSGITISSRMISMRKAAFLAMSSSPLSKGYSSVGIPLCSDQMRIICTKRCRNSLSSSHTPMRSMPLTSSCR